MNRRSLLTGGISFLAMPAIVRASALMPVRGDVYEFWRYKLPLFPPLPIFDNDSKFSTEGYLGPNGRLFQGTWTFFSKKGHRSIYDPEVSFSKQEFAA